MKILWIVNMVLPDLAKELNIKTGASGTWLTSLSSMIGNEKNVELAVACIYGKEFQKHKVGNIVYYCIPGNGKTMLFYKKGLVKYWDKIEEDFLPDIVHFYGTEYSHGVSYLRKYKDKKKVLTIQGIIEKTSKNHWGGMAFSKVLFNRTFKEFIHLNGMCEKKLLARRNVKYENEIIKSVDYATGRTDWDKYYMQSINANLKYYRCYFNLRDEFYNAEKWSLDKVNRNVIYASTSAQVPMKGGHIVIEALRLAKKFIPDIKVVFLASKQKNFKLIPTSGYTKYISKLIKKYDLEENVKFINRLNTNEVIEVMTSSHIALIPSAIENASATLREAMHLGVPCIASFRGGMTELIDNGKNGFLYDYEEAEYLAGRIVELLKDDNLAQEFSKKAIASSSKWHDKENNKNSYIKMYEEIMKNGGKE